MEKQKILVIEDDEKAIHMITQSLSREGYHVVVISDKKRTDLTFPLREICLAIMNVTMKGVDIWQTCREIRKKSDMPIIILTAKGYEVEELYSFEMGADDYIAKPFSPQILAARVNTHLRKTVIMPPCPNHAGLLEIDEPGHSIALNGESMDLTPKEYELLLFLVHHKGSVLTRKQILSLIWEYDFSGDCRTVDTHIKKIRSKLGSQSGYIQTVRGIGYKFDP